MSIAGVTDADNPGGTISNATYVWQEELAPGTGVFTDIILKPGAQIGLTTLNIQAADQYTNIFVTIEEWAGPNL